jgi:hypothetical protein
MAHVHSAIVALLALGLPTVGFAQPMADHLECFKVRSPEAKATYTANLDGLVPEPGCVIKVPAAIMCVPTTKTRVSPTPPGGGPTGVPNGFNCYQVRCPKTALPAVRTEDQFGIRTATVRASKLLCAPFEPPAPPTTTTTSSTTTTSTTVPTCAGGGIGCGNTCAGSCRCMGPGTTTFCPGIHCGSFDQACVDVSVPAGNPCSFDSACPAGQACVAPSPQTCSATVGGPGHCFPICPE